jgi:hypothetical protein
MIPRDQKFFGVLVAVARVCAHPASASLRWLVKPLIQKINTNSKIALQKKAPRTFESAGLGAKKQKFKKSFSLRVFVAEYLCY